MSGGESSGGGQSSLGYLFGSEEQPSQPLPAKTVTVPLPPYGIDIDNLNVNGKPPQGGGAPSKTQFIVSNRSQGQHLGNFVTVSFRILYLIMIASHY